VSPEELKKIIIEEVLRALAEMGVIDASPRSAQSASSSAAPSTSLGSGIVLFTGYRSPTPESLDSLLSLGIQGGRLSALLSFSFNQTQFKQNPNSIQGLRVVENSDDELAMQKLIENSDWLIAPDVSWNTLNKVVLGIEDSTPSRALGDGIRLGTPCFFLESALATTKTGGSPRLDLIRKVAVRGARLTCPESLVKDLYDTLDSKTEKVYVPPAPRPVTKRGVVTKDDVYESFALGVKELIVPANSIVTAEAYEDAHRRGMTIRLEEERG